MYPTAERPELDTKTTKELRALLQDVVDKLSSHNCSRPTSIAITKLEEAKMWLGKHLATLPENEDLNAIRDAEELSK